VPLSLSRSLPCHFICSYLFMWAPTFVIKSCTSCARRSLRLPADNKLLRFCEDLCRGRPLNNQPARPLEPNGNWIKNGVTRRLAPKIKLPSLDPRRALACLWNIVFLVRTEARRGAANKATTRPPPHAFTFSAAKLNKCLCCAANKPPLWRAGRRGRKIDATRCAHFVL
jgi:hypothetical protein